jgi:hypothetical protein
MEMTASNHPDIEADGAPLSLEPAGEIDVQTAAQQPRQVNPREVEDGHSLEPVPAEELESQFLHHRFLVIEEPAGDVGVQVVFGHRLRPAEGARFVRLP